MNLPILIHCIYIFIVKGVLVHFNVYSGPGLHFEIINHSFLNFPWNNRRRCVL